MYFLLNTFYSQPRTTIHKKTGYPEAHEQSPQSRKKFKNSSRNKKASTTKPIAHVVLRPSLQKHS
jgi:hypothetical protein